MIRLLQFEIRTQLQQHQKLLQQTFLELLYIRSLVMSISIQSSQASIFIEINLTFSSSISRSFFSESRYFSCQMFLSILSIYFHRKSVKSPNREKKERGVINSLSSLSPEIVDSRLVMALSSC